MKLRCMCLVCGLTLALAGQSQADAVDDLLAGKPIEVAPAERQAPTIQPIAGPVNVPHAPVAQWSIDGEGNIDSTSRALSAAEMKPGPAAPSTAISLVPEPSAVALAGLALLYFLIFFRRRQYV